MVRLKSREYSGYVDTTQQDKIVVIISTSDVFQDVAAQTNSLSEVVETDANGNTTTHTVTRPLGISSFAPGMYAIHLSTKLTETEELRAALSAQNSVIDMLIVASLEET